MLTRIKKVMGMVIETGGNLSVEQLNEFHAVYCELDQRTPSEKGTVQCYQTSELQRTG